MARKRFTVYNHNTREVIKQVNSYQLAEAIANRSPERYFDDTCDHDTAYSICKEDHA